MRETVLTFHLLAALLLLAFVSVHAHRLRPPAGDFRGTFGNAIAGVANAIAPDKCIGDLMMTGYSSDQFGEDDYRFQPSCYNQGAQNELTCFPATANVFTDRGTTTMSDLNIGDFVLTYDEKAKKMKFEKIMFFLHRKVHRVGGDWVDVRHEFGMLTLSSTHMLFKSFPEGIVSVAAKRLQAGDTLKVARDNGTMMDSTVRSVSPAADQRGAYAPVTESGTVIVNGVLASSYSSLDMFGQYENRAHSILDLAAAPLKAIANRPRVAYCISRALDVLRKLSLGVMVGTAKAGGSVSVEEDPMYTIIGAAEAAFVKVRSASV